MKALIVFTSLVLGYSMLNMVQLKVGASTYKDGVSVSAYMNNQAHRSPAIVYKRK